MTTSSPSAGAEIDVAMLPSVLRRAMLPLLLVSALVGGIVYGALLTVPSHFTSEAQIRIGGSSGIGDAASRADREAIASRVQELRSPDLARKLIDELKLNRRPEFNSALDNGGLAGGVLRLVGLAGPRPGETEEERVLAAYDRALQVYQVKDTRVITLAFTARDGDLAAKAANRLIELYQQWLREQGVSETTDANAWLLPEIEKRTRELSTAESEVERFRTSANLFRGGTGQASGLAEQQLTDLTAELNRARAQRSEAEARAAAARELMNKGTPDAIPDVQKSPVIQGLIAERVRAERDLAEASSQLLPAHPRMKQLTANVNDIRRHVQREARTIVDGLERETKALALREELASRALDDAKSRLGDKAGDRVRLAQLEDDARAKRRELDGLRERFEAARSRGTVKAVPVEVQVIATALPSSRPAWPKRAQMAMLAALATFVLGLSLVLLRAILGAARAPDVRTAGRREPRPVADASPAISEPRLDTIAAPATEPTRHIERGLAAAFSRRREPTGVAQPTPEPSETTAIVTRLLANSDGKSGYRTIIVGSEPTIAAYGEAVSIATALSARGRDVVLVECSADGQGLAAMLDVRASPGFAELLTGTASFEDVIATVAASSLHVIPAGRRNAGAEFDANRLNLTLDALDEAYGDVVITGSHTDVRALFEAIEGRIDAGVLVTAASAEGGDDGDGRFLGFEVSEIDVLRLDHSRGDVAGRRPTGVDRALSGAVGAA